MQAHFFIKSCSNSVSTLPLSWVMHFTERDPPVFWEEASAWLPDPGDPPFRTHTVKDAIPLCSTWHFIQALPSFRVEVFSSLTSSGNPLSFTRVWKGRWLAFQMGRMSGSTFLIHCYPLNSPYRNWNLHFLRLQGSPNQGVCFGWAQQAEGTMFSIILRHDHLPTGLQVTKFY